MTVVVAIAVTIKASVFFTFEFDVVVREKSQTRCFDRDKMQMFTN
jgi:hypothetical protein